MVVNEQNTAEEILKKWLEEKKNRNDRELEKHQKMIRETTQNLLKKQEWHRGQIGCLANELALMEKLCKNKHSGNSCPDCSWETY